MSNDPNGEFPAAHEHRKIVERALRTALEDRERYKAERDEERKKNAKLLAAFFAFVGELGDALNQGGK